MRLANARILLLVVVGLVGLPSWSVAQSAISGQVADTSGAVLPGVTIEAASPVLIEKVRTTTTDAQGLYTLVDLRPGTYVVTFTLSGFATLRREGVQVSSNVNLPVNVELSIGGLEETLTVSGQAAVVDVRTASRTAVLERGLLDNLPTSRTYTTAGAIVPGIKLTKPDIGGTQAVQQAYTVSRGMVNHQDNMMMIDGLLVKLNGTTSQAYTNFSMVEEVTYQTTGLAADTSGGGVRVNMIPKDGGNTYQGYFFMGGSSGKWQSNDITQELRDRGLPSPTSTDYLYDLNPSFGGPLKRDALWFFGSYRRLVLNTRPGGFYQDGRPAIEDQWIDSGSARVTWQMSPRHRLTAYKDRAWKERDTISPIWFR
ncbi:MAG: TonB-dependent receptor [Vicinamibacterales bacterium]